jgi:hypothetical protein
MGESELQITWTKAWLSVITICCSIFSPFLLNTNNKPLTACLCGIDQQMRKVRRTWDRFDKKGDLSYKSSREITTSFRNASNIAETCRTTATKNATYNCQFEELQL